MKIPLTNWGTKPIFTKENASRRYLLKIPNQPLSELALGLGELEVKPMGLVPHYEPSVQAANFTTMALLRDWFPGYAIYGVVPTWSPRPHVRAMKAAGFNHLLLQYQKPWEHFYQEVHDLLDRCSVHVAGGDPTQDAWTWSDEALF